MISVLISTKNRPKQLQECLNSLLRSTFHDFEILVADQNSNSETEKIIFRCKSKKVKYIKTQKRGRSAGLNLLLEEAKGKILAFTDDDCIVDMRWLEEIHLFFESHPRIAGVFGNTIPFQPELHLQETCPATFITDKMSAFHDPSTIHYKSLGLGNNMSLRKSVIDHIGFFRNWLGVGTISRAGEESDLIFRILLKQYILMTNPKMLVYHNRWLKRKNENIQQSNYTLGLMSFFSYYFLLGNQRKYARAFMKTRFSERAIPLFKQIQFLTKELMKESVFLVLEILSIFKGICIGSAMAIQNQILNFFSQLNKVHKNSIDE